MGRDFEFLKRSTGPQFFVHFRQKSYFCTIPGYLETACATNEHLKRKSNTGRPSPIPLKYLRYSTTVSFSFSNESHMRTGGRLGLLRLELRGPPCFCSHYSPTTWQWVWRHLCILWWQHFWKSDRRRDYWHHVEAWMLPRVFHWHTNVHIPGCVQKPDVAKDDQ